MKIAVFGTGSVGETLGSKLLKALNTMSCFLMVAPRQLADSHHTFVAGNDAGAKAQVKTILASFGWKPEEVIDVGDLTGARATEQYLPLWARLYGTLKVGNFNIKIVR